MVLKQKKDGIDDVIHASFICRFVLHDKGFYIATAKKEDSNKISFNMNGFLIICVSTEVHYSLVILVGVPLIADKDPTAKYCI